MKKILLSILALMGLSQAMISDFKGPDYAEMKAELAVLEKLNEQKTDQRFSRLPNEQKTDQRFSRFPVVPPIKPKHQPKPPSGKPKMQTRPGHRKLHPSAMQSLNQTYTIKDEKPLEKTYVIPPKEIKKPLERKRWNKDDNQKLIEALNKLPCKTCK